jgi:hypothetical protein
MQAILGEQQLRLSKCVGAVAEESVRWRRGRCRGGGVGVVAEGSVSWRGANCMLGGQASAGDQYMTVNTGYFEDFI